MKIAVLDDELPMLQMLEQVLMGDKSWTFPVEFSFFSSGMALFASMQTVSYDCLILDRVVPDMSGDSILTWLRDDPVRKNTAVIMLTSRRSEADTVASLNAGADDYVTKPFRPDELIARVSRLLKRQALLASLGDVDASADEPSEFVFNDYVFDAHALSLKIKGEPIGLTEREFSLALFFFNNMNQSVSREEIFKEVWHRREVPTSRALDTHVYHLRKVLGLGGEGDYALRTVYGFGYRLNEVGSRR